MKKLIKSTLVAASVVVALAFAGCANETVEYVYVSPPSQASVQTQTPTSFDGQLSKAEEKTNNVTSAKSAEEVVDSAKTVIPQILTAMKDANEESKILYATIAQKFAKASIESVSKTYARADKDTSITLKDAAKNEIEANLGKARALVDVEIEPVGSNSDGDVIAFAAIGGYPTEKEYSADEVAKFARDAAELAEKALQKLLTELTEKIVDTNIESELGLIPANLSHWSLAQNVAEQAGVYKDLYSGSTYKLTNAYRYKDDLDTHYVTVAATSLQKHNNGSAKAGYWVGVGVSEKKAKDADSFSGLYGSAPAFFKKIVNGAEVDGDKYRFGYWNLEADESEKTFTYTGKDEKTKTVNVSFSVTKTDSKLTEKKITAVTNGANPPSGQWIIPATLAERDEVGQETGRFDLYEERSYYVQEMYTLGIDADTVYTTLRIRGLKKHRNGAGQEGYWLGLGFAKDTLDKLDGVASYDIGWVNKDAGTLFANDLTRGVQIGGYAKPRQPDVNGYATKTEYGKEYFFRYFNFDPQNNNRRLCVNFKDANGKSLKRVVVTVDGTVSTVSTVSKERVKEPVDPYKDWGMLPLDNKSEYEFKDMYYYTDEPKIFYLTLKAHNIPEGTPPANSGASKGHWFGIRIPAGKYAPADGWRMANYGWVPTGEIYSGSKWIKMTQLAQIDWKDNNNGAYYDTIEENNEQNKYWMFYWDYKGDANKRGYFAHKDKNGNIAYIVLVDWDCKNAN